MSTKTARIASYKSEFANESWVVIPTIGAFTRTELADWVNCSFFQEFHPLFLLRYFVCPVPSISVITGNIM